jgi:cell division protease FtsH
VSVRLVTPALVALLLLAAPAAALADGPSNPSTTSSAPRSYAELRAALNRHEVSSVLLVPPRGEIRATMADGHSVRLHYPPSDESLPGALVRSGAEVEVRNQVPQGGSGRTFMGIMMLVLLVTLIPAVFAWRRLRNAAEGGARRPRAGDASGLRADVQKGEADRPALRFSDVAGCDEAVEEVREVLDFTRDPERFARLGARPPRGIMLYGPPGTGKTLLAKALAGEAGLAFFAVSGSEFVEKYVGTGASRVRELFAKARTEEAGAVIFIDEIDAVGRRRSAGEDGSNSESEKTLNQLLVELDGFDTGERVVCVAATNRLDTLDEALLRPGRFGRQIHVDVPSEGGRLEILHLHGRGKPLGEDVDLKRLARITAGSSGAELAEMLNEAAIMTARAGGEEIGQAELEEGHLRVLAGPRKQASMLAEGEREVVAIHEAGHVLCAELCPTHDKAQRATVQPRGKAAGLAVYGRTDRALMGEREVHEKLICILGGRAAELVAVGTVSSGAANDLQQANALARQAVEELGLSARVGQIVTCSARGPVRVADPTLAAIDDEVRRLVAEAYVDAVALVRAHRPGLDALAEALVASQAVDRLEIEALLAAAPAAEPERPALAPVPPAPRPAPALRPRGQRHAAGARGARPGLRRALAAFARRRPPRTVAVPAD